eukprot:2526159-Amphidinium_carterae.1
MEIAPPLCTTHPALQPFLEHLGEGATSPSSAPVNSDFLSCSLRGAEGFLSTIQDHFLATTTASMRDMTNELLGIDSATFERRLSMFI